MRYLLHAQPAPFDLHFPELMLLEGESDNSFNPPLFQCVSEESVGIATYAICAVFTELRKTVDKDRAWQLLSSHPRYSNSATSRFDDDVRTIWSMVKPEHQITALRFALVRFFELFSVYECHAVLHILIACDHTTK